MNETNTDTKLTTTFVDPYEDSPHTHRLVANVDKQAINSIYTIRPFKGTLQIVINQLWSKLVNELNKRGIKSIDQQEQFEQFVAGCRIAGEDEYNPERDSKDETNSNPIQRSSITRSLPPSSPRDDARASAPASANDKVVKNKPTNSKKTTRGTKSGDRGTTAGGSEGVKN